VGKEYVRAMVAFLTNDLAAIRARRRLFGADALDDWVDGMLAIASMSRGTHGMRHPHPSPLPASVTPTSTTGTSPRPARCVNPTASATFTLTSGGHTLKSSPAPNRSNARCATRQGEPAL
jgi:hypothetical protein